MSSNIADFLHDSALRHPEAVCVIVGDSEYTWARVDADASHVAAGLIGRGLRPGDRIAMLLGNSYEFVVLYFAAARAGLVSVPLNPAYTSAEVAVLLADSGARLLVVQPSTLDVGQESAAALPGCELVNVADPEWESIAVAGVERPVVHPATSPDALALLLFTAGTSGRPKGAMLTHGALRANIEMLLSLSDPPAVVDRDVVLMVLPMFHVYGLNTALGLAVAAGATCVILDRFDPVDSLGLVARHGVTTIAGAPAMYQAWCATPGLRDGMATVRMLSSGGAPLPPRVFAAFAEITGHEIFEGYGMTETAPVVATTLVSGRPKAGSVGKPLPGLEIRLVDDSGGDVDEGDPGEVWVRGPSVFRGYWPDAAGGPDADGWFRSGDVAYADDDGDLHVVDRRREVILVNGFNVYPREIELIIDDMPGVAEAAVVGVPDDTTGEAVTALVVARRGVTLLPEEIAEHCALRLARFKCPTVIRVVDALPHSATGKVAKGRLRDVYGDTGYGS
ncbi:MAG: AMP-binding protein [Actinobacteria bacterium]|nr:AMP-binding protein [Actinomycetota bacterium]